MYNIMHSFANPTWTHYRLCQVALDWTCWVAWLHCNSDICDINASRCRRLVRFVLPVLLKSLQSKALGLMVLDVYWGGGGDDYP